MKLGEEKTFICAKCGQQRKGVRRRCYQCTAKPLSDEGKRRLREANLGKRASDESRRKNAEWHKLHTEHYFQLGETTRGKRPHNWKPIGAERLSNGHIQVKVTQSGRWKYRARFVWESSYGPLRPSQIIHHRNGDPFDDRLENLQMVTRSEHAVLHAVARLPRGLNA